MRFDALLYGIELAYLVGKKYNKGRSDLFKKASAIASVGSNIPEIAAQAELIDKILHTDRGSVVEIFTDLLIWTGIQKVIDKINANALAA